MGALLVACSLVIAGVSIAAYGLMMLGSSAPDLDVIWFNLDESGAQAFPLGPVREVLICVMLGGMSDIQFGTVFAVLPALALSVGFGWLGRLLLRRDARSQDARDSRSPILYLRSFDEDRTTIAAPSLRRGVARLVPWQGRSFEQLLERSLATYGRMVTVSDPRSRMGVRRGALRQGADRFALPHDIWQDEVQAMARSAVVVVMSATPQSVQPGLSAELGMLADLGRGARVLLVIGPYTPETTAVRWEGWRRAAVRRGSRLFGGLEPAWTPPGTQVLSHSSTSGWLAWGARERTDRSYQAALDQAFAHESERWQQEVREQAQP